MSQHKPPGMSNEQYLNELLAEHEKHKSLVGDARFPHSDRLLVAEIERVTASSEALKVNANWKLHEVKSPCLTSSEGIRCGGRHARQMVWKPPKKIR